MWCSSWLDWVNIQSSISPLYHLWSYDRKKRKCPGLKGSTTELNRATSRPSRAAITYRDLGGQQAFSSEDLRYTLFRFKRYNLFQYFSKMKSSENKFDLFTCILPDYVGHESIKELLKNSHFENMKAGFLLKCQN